MDTSQPILTQLAENGILSPDEAAKVQATLDSGELKTSAKQLADQLVQLNKLTPYQAKTLAAGDVKNLVLGNYVLLDQLGEGGMGRVYKARHRGMDRTVAVKMLLPEKLGSKSGLKRFNQEVKAAARLTHPNIVTAFDADVSGEVPYLVMEYVDGQDLQSRLAKQGRLSIADAVDYTRQTARGLQYAHSVGIIHRDIKPGNLLLDKHGLVRILDMGVAQVRQNIGEETPGDIHTQLTRDGAVIGTVDFMAPEQAASAKQADERSDIYSLGCTLYFLLTNEPVFRAESVVDRLIAHRQRPIPSLRAARPDVPPALDAIFQRMVAKDPAERYASMTEVMAALDSLGAAAVSTAPAPPANVAVNLHEMTTVNAGATTPGGEIQWVGEETGLRAAPLPATRDVSPLSRSVSPTTLALILLAALFLSITAFFAYDMLPGGASLAVEISEPGAFVVVVDDRIDQAVASGIAQGESLTFQLPAGDYRVQVAKDGFKTVEVNVSLRAWKRTRVNISLPKPNYSDDLKLDETPGPR